MTETTESAVAATEDVNADGEKAYEMGSVWMVPLPPRSSSRLDSTSIERRCPCTNGFDSSSNSRRRNDPSANTDT